VVEIEIHTSKSMPFCKWFHLLFLSYCSWFFSVFTIRIIYNSNESCWCKPTSFSAIGSCILDAKIRR